MTVLAVITGISIIFLIILYIQRSKEEEGYTSGVCCGLVLAALFILEIICICESISKSHPKAMDVYQGKTILEYTIRDGVKIDSIVVFKDKNYDKK